MAGSGGARASDGLPPAAWQRLLTIMLVALVIVGAGGWGVGWLAGRLTGRGQAPAPALASPTAASPSASPPTETPALDIIAPPVPTTDATLPAAPGRATSTPAPTSTPTPAEQKITVLPGEGLYAVCRRYCPGVWPLSGYPQELVRYAEEVARLNNLSGPSGQWHLEPDWSLQMPPCPH